MPSFEHLTTFLRIIDSGSLSAAGRTLGLSASAVSRQLVALEAELGANLLVRTTRQLALTDAGRRFEVKARDVMRAMDEAHSVVHDDPMGRLVVSVPVTFGLARIVPLVAKLMHEHPGLELELRLDDRIVDLLSEGVDVAIRGGVERPSQPDLVVHELFVFDRLLVASPGLMKQHPTLRRGDDPELLSSVPLLGQGQTGRTTWALTRSLIEAHSKPAETRRIKVLGPVSSNAPLVLRELCEAGLGVALLPDWLVEDALEAGRLVRVLPGWSAVPSAMRAVYRVELRQLASIRALLTVLGSGLRATASAPQSTGRRKGPPKDA